MIKRHPNLLIHTPGQVLVNRFIKDRKIIEKDYAKKVLKMNEEEFNSFIEGKIKVTIEIAASLKKLTGVSEAYWLGRQHDYDASQ